MLSAKRRCLYACALGVILLLVIAAYSNTFQSPPVLDDFHTFVKNPSVHVDHWSVETVKRLSDTHFGLARWIPMTTFALDYYLGGGEYYQFHLTNLAIHLLATMVVFFLVQQCLQASAKDKNRLFGLAPALWIAALWALNPVQTNAVTYLVQRMASLQALFFSAGVAFYIKGRLKYLETGSVKAVLPWFCLTGLFAIFAFLTKENSAMLPVMLVVTEIWFFSPDGISRTWRWVRNRSRWSRILMAVVVLLVSLQVLGVVYQLLTSYGSRYFGPWQRLLTESRVIVWYMGLLLLPLPQRLSIEHDVLLSTSVISPPTTLLSIAFLSLLMVVIVAYRKRYPLITYGGAWFFLNLAIESTLVPLELVFEHRLYLPSVGFVMAVVLVVLAFTGRIRQRFSDREWRQLAWAAVAILCACSTLLTFYRNEDWRDVITFNQDAVEKAPNLPRTHANYASALLRAGRFDEAREQAEKTFALGRPGLEDYVVAADTIVGSYMRQENWQEAASRGEELLQDRPKDSDAMSLPQLLLRVAESFRQIHEYRKAYNYAMDSVTVMAGMGRQSPFLMPYAVDVLRQLLAVAHADSLDLDRDGLPDPGNVKASIWIAKAFVRVEAYGTARQLLSKLLEEEPNDTLALTTLTELNQFLEKNLLQGRQWDFSTKYVKQPYSPFKLCMAVAYVIRKQDPSNFMLKVGEQFIRWAQRLDPAHPDVHLLRGWYFYERNQIADAISEARAALALDPEYAKAWMGLGLFLMNNNQQDQRAAAVAAFERVLDLYPGYKKRRVILDMVAQLKGRKPPSESLLEAFDKGPAKPTVTLPAVPASG